MLHLILKREPDDKFAVLDVGLQAENEIDLKNILANIRKNLTYRVLNFVWGATPTGEFVDLTQRHHLKFLNTNIFVCYVAGNTYKWHTRTPEQIAIAEKWKYARITVDENNFIQKITC